jgi:hypothetical protein
MFYITGSSRGLGKYLAEHFDCTQFNHPLDLNFDVDEICAAIPDGSTVILNAHGNQLEYVELLKDRCKIIVMGSIAAVNHDPNMPEYSKQKKELEDSVRQFALHNKHPMLYLQLTSSSYRDYATVARSIEFWLDNPTVTFIGYNINE